MSVRNDYGNYGGRWPAIVREYDAATRLCRVEIPGVTDGADPLPNAEIEYPIGDKSRHEERETEIEILPDDEVWVAFIGGDSRYPIITGYRNARSGNGEDWRRWHHKNIAVLADEAIEVLARQVNIGSVPASSAMAELVEIIALQVCIGHAGSMLCFGIDSRAGINAAALDVQAVQHISLKAPRIDLN